MCIRDRVIALPAMKPSTLLTDKTLIRITTVPIALAYPLRGQPAYMKSRGIKVVLISSDGKELPLVVARAVSYTHLDVYKRQSTGRMPLCSVVFLSWEGWLPTAIWTCIM